MKKSEFERIAWVIKHTEMPIESRRNFVLRFISEFSGDHERFDARKFAAASFPEHQALELGELLSSL